MQEIHERLGHIAPDSIRQMIQDGTVTGITLDEAHKLMGTCDSCEYVKLMCKPRGKLRDPLRQSNLGDEVHTDLWGPSPVQTGRHSYYASFTDDYTRYTRLYLQKVKSNTFDSYQAFEAWLSTQFNTKVKHLRLDRGGEYLSAEFTKYLKSKGTECRVTVHDTPEHNGVAERLNRTLVERVCAMMYASGMLKSLWGEAVMHATWVKNCTSTCQLGKKTPYEMLYQKKPNLENILVWGCRVKVHDTSGMKLDMQARDGHQIYFPDRGNIGIEWSAAFEQRDASAPPRTMASTPIEGEQVPHVEPIPEVPEHEEVNQHAEPTSKTTANTPVDHLGSNFESPDPQPQLRQSSCQCFESEYFRWLQDGQGTVDGRKPKETAALTEVLHGGMNEGESPDDNDVVYAMATRVSEAEGLDPSTIDKAHARPDWPKWDKAILKELASLEAAHTWDVVKCPKGVNIVGCKWVFKIKRNAVGEINKYKAQLVVKGYSQVQGVDYDETYAPVARLSSLHTILAVATRNDWDVDVFDFQSTFLNGKLNEGEDLYMELPPVYKVDKGLRHTVAKLQVALYGSKQGALKWYLKLCSSLKELGLGVHSDWGIFYAHIGCNILILASHVDDCTLTGSSGELMGLFKDEIRARYKITDLGPISWVLGMKVIRDRVTQTISLSQEPYVDTIIFKYNFSDLKPISIPMDPSI